MPELTQGTAAANDIIAALKEAKKAAAKTAEIGKFQEAIDILKKALNDNKDRIDSAEKLIKDSNHQNSSSLNKKKNKPNPPIAHDALDTLKESESEINHLLEIYHNLLQLTKTALDPKSSSPNTNNIITAGIEIFDILAILQRLSEQRDSMTQTHILAFQKQILASMGNESEEDLLKACKATQQLLEMDEPTHEQREAYSTLAETMKGRPNLELLGSIMLLLVAAVSVAIAITLGVLALPATATAAAALTAGVSGTLGTIGIFNKTGKTTNLSESMRAFGEKRWHPL